MSDDRRDDWKERRERSRRIREEFRHTIERAVLRVNRAFMD